MRATVPSVSLAADAVAFLVVAPLIGSAVGSFGFWLLALVGVPPIALATTIYVSALPGLLALAMARLVRSGRVRGRYAPGIAAAVGMVAFIVLSDARIVPVDLDYKKSREGINAWTQAWLVIAAFAVGWLSVQIGSEMRRPFRTAGLIVGGLAGYWALWSVMT